MKKLSVLVLALVAGSAMATAGGEGNNTGCNGVGNANSPCAGSVNNGGNGGAGGNGGQGGQGGSGGVGIGNGGTGIGGVGHGGNASLIGSGNSTNLISNTAQGGQGGAGGSASSSSSATGGAGGNATGGNATGGTATVGAITTGGNQLSTGTQTLTGGSQSLTVTGDTYIAPKPAAATSYAPHSSGPLMTCRIFVGLGASIREGSLSGGIPVGNDQTCMSDANLRFMDKVNAIQAGTFGAADYLRAVCKAEGMAELKGCKGLQ